MTNKERWEKVVSSMDEILETLDEVDCDSYYNNERFNLYVKIRCFVEEQANVIENTFVKETA